MKRVLLVAAALGVAAAPMAWGQEQRGDHPGGGGGRPAGAHPGAPQGARPGGAPGARPGGGFQGGGFQGGGVQGARPGGGFQGGADRPNAQPGGGFQGRPNPGFQGGGFQGRPNPGFQGGGVRPGDNHAAPGFRGGAGFQGRPGGGFAFTGSRGAGAGFHGAGQFSYRGRTFSRFRAAPFRYPAGWGYRRWTVGAFLPALFLTSGYFIYDFSSYGLGPPPPGCQWVRYGPDALLVNAYTGAVVDVVYGVFWW